MLRRHCTILFTDLQQIDDVDTYSELYLVTLCKKVPYSSVATRRRFSTPNLHEEKDPKIRYCTLKRVQLVQPLFVLRVVCIHTSILPPTRLLRTREQLISCQS